VRTYSSVPAMWAPLPLTRNIALGAHNAKLNADIRTLSSPGTTSIHFVYDYYSFALEDGGHMAPMHP
jgi:hypothetical protein